LSGSNHAYGVVLGDNRIPSLAGDRCMYPMVVLGPVDMGQ
jgi:hypothetical protein